MLSSHFKFYTMTKSLNLPITLLFCLLYNLLGAQEWVQQHPNQDVKQMNDIFVGADNYGYAVGNGMVFSTFDGGENWTKREAGVPQYKNWTFAFYQDGSNGDVAYISSNVNYRTTNGGDTWEQVNLGENQNTIAKEMAALPGGVLLLMGSDKILRSSDSGSTWTLVFEPADFTTSMTFPVDNQGWLATQDGSIYHSGDGGEIWTVLEGTPFTDKVQITFVDNNLGYACEGKNIFKTEDGGQNWEMIAENAISTYPSDFDAAGANNLYATKGFRINYSIDGGLTWDYTGGVSYGYSMKNVHTLSDGRAWVGGTYGAIIYSDDPAVGWEDQLEGVKDRLRFVKFLDSQTGLAGGGDWTLIKTTNGGNDWQDITFPHDDFDNFNDAILLDENTYLLAGRGTIYRTTDGGSNWIETLADIGNYVAKLYQTDNGTLFAAGENGKIYRSEDQGLSWDEIYEIGGFEWLNSIFFVNDQTGYACGRDGIILKTDDGGDSWTEQESGSEDNLYDIAFFNENEGFACMDGWNDSLLYTSNGGLEWTTIGMPGTAIFRSLCFVNDSVGYVTTAAAFSGAVFQTYDAGQNWEMIHSNGFAFYDMEHIFDGEFDHLWISGDGGLIEYWTNTIVNTTEQDYEVNRLQVFPNPSDGNDLNVNWPENNATTVFMECYNAQGQLMISQEIKTNSGVVNLQNNLTQGTYFLKMIDSTNKKLYFETLTVIR
ncbi:MAG: T9SS C-terminal target domain-containing protein [Bacteroidetes bacterium]|nr:MAG: T9SS C-terminal target domain-containing protein [Bacteroidota bacterium]